MRKAKEILGKGKKLGWPLTVGAVILGILIVSALGAYFFQADFLSALRAVVGTVLVIFVPGFCLTWGFFPNKKGEKEEIDWLERITLSFGLSIATVPLIVFYLNLLLGVPINLWSALGAIAFISLAGLFLYWLRLNPKRAPQAVRRWL